MKRMLRRLGTERNAVTSTTILEFPPSDAAQVDFGAGPVLTHESGLPLKTWIFVMTLCWSRHQYNEIVLDQQTGDVSGLPPARLRMVWWLSRPGHHR
ncbi:hypothetical protein [Candidatus Burkholderia verschuerenii]|uniref:hypothetical protein n=1 Tax=Candidatus Burkholderia verschuerenii TaxID=242163 RepID=UPI000A5F4D0E|nr:hypothetical protein [Candidatus Burkholderia verschuerenii]